MNSNDREFTWEEIRTHVSKNDKWTVIDGFVYDITSWAQKHPGGEIIISNYAGQDASDAWFAFHINKTMVRKYMKPLLVGRLKMTEDEGIHDTETSICKSTDHNLNQRSVSAQICASDTKMKETPLEKDFRDLRKKVEDLGYFEPKLSFFVLIMLHILALEAAGWCVLNYFGTGWVPYIIAVALLTTSQMQAGFNQHDYGHYYVFNTLIYNKWTHIFQMNFFKGLSSAHWNHRHYQHHAKPNVIHLDKDIEYEVPFFGYLLLIGKVIPEEWGLKKKGYLPYQYQHTFFHFLLPPSVIFYLHFENFCFLIKSKNWMELFWTLMFFLRWHLMFTPILGAWGCVYLFLLVTCLESHWFVWTSSMSHLPMAVDYDKEDDWVTMQLKATCDIEQSYFNNWVSGHLNYQIEHHLFPTMPRHNWYKVVPMVKSLCKKHGLVYHTKPLSTALADIVRSFKDSGKMWYDVYHLD